MFDYPNNPASALIYDVLRAEQARTGDPILDTILLTPNLRPRELEDNVDRLLGGSHPGTTFRGAIGLATVVGSARRQLGVTVVIEPKSRLPAWALRIVGEEQPDLWLLAVGGQVVLDGAVVTVTPGLKDVVSQMTSERVGDIDSPEQPLQVFGEVTTSRHFLHLQDRMEKVERWANAIPVGGIPGVSTFAVFTIDRSVWFDATTADAKDMMLEIIRRSDAVVHLARNLKTLTLERANRIYAGIKLGRPLP